MEDNKDKLTLNKDGSYDYDGDCNLSKLKLVEITIQFNKIAGHFSCVENKLTSLKGGPKIVKGSFWCSFNNLKTLEHCPESIGGSFICNYNKLTSLEYCPKIVNGRFLCDNNNLTSLEYCPKIVKESFWCNDNKTKFTKEDVEKVCKVGGDIVV